MGDGSQTESWVDKKFEGDTARRSFNGGSRRSSWSWGILFCGALALGLSCRVTETPSAHPPTGADATSSQVSISTPAVASDGVRDTEDKERWNRSDILLTTLLDVPWLTGVELSGDGEHFFVAHNQSGAYEVYDFGRDGSTPRQLTNLQETSLKLETRVPGTNTLILSFDKGGDEISHLYALEDDGKIRELTPGHNVRTTFSRLSSDATQLYFVSNELGATRLDVFSLEIATGKKTLHFRNDDGLTINAISPSGRFIAAQRVNTNADADLLLIDNQRPGRPVEIAGKKDVAINNVGMSFSPDEKYLLYASDMDSEYRRLWSFELRSKRERLLLDGEGDIVSVGFSPSGKYYRVVRNERAWNHAHLFRWGDAVEVAVPDFGELRYIEYLFGENDEIIAGVQSDRHPTRYYQIDPNSDEAPKLRADFTPAGLEPEKLVSGEDVTYSSFDGVEVPAILYRGVGASANTPGPALLALHGGPGGQMMHGFSSWIQLMATQGYTILSVNYRGSSGYGKTYHAMDDRRHGEVDLQDCVYAKHYLEEFDWIQRDQVGVYGWSYGGYLVVAALAFRPQTFRVGIDVFGVVNWPRTLRSTPPWWAAGIDGMFTELGDPNVDNARLTRISPLFFVHQIERPLLIEQGTNDPRVLQSESDELVERMKAAGKIVEYVLLENEGHGFRRKSSSMRAAKAELRFLSRHLRGVSPGNDDTRN